MWLLVFLDQFMIAEYSGHLHYQQCWSKNVSKLYFG
nr:unnamed protein product [Callosobruchus analis]